jgi:hypothetical protein
MFIFKVLAIEHLYIPRIGNSSIICDLEDAKIKHHNYFQVVLDDSIVKNVYVELFFSSDLGKLVLKALYGDLIVPHINKKGLEDILIPIPKISEQENIIKTKDRLTTLQFAIEQFENELSLNPKSAQEIQSRIDTMLEDLSMLSEADRIRSIIRKGESKKIEFKQTLSLDIKKKIDTKAKYLEKSVLKTIAAFLNTEGGAVLVGVTDEGNIYGLHKEISKFHKNNDDNFLLHFKNLMLYH